jgi:HEAT repeat protein
MKLTPCPFCGKSIPARMSVCPYCRRDEKGDAVVMDTRMSTTAAEAKPSKQHLDELSSEDPYVRDQAVLRMAKQGFGVTQVLIDILSDHAKPGLASVAKTLGQIGDKRAIGVLTKAAKHGDDGLRIAALWALAQYRDAEVLPVLLSEAERPHPMTQSYLAHVLGLIQDAQVVPVLCRITQNGSPEAAYQAAFALGEWKDPQSVAALTHLAQKKNPLLRAVAIASLKRLGVNPVFTAAGWRLWAWGVGALSLIAGGLWWIYR